MCADDALETAIDLELPTRTSAEHFTSTAGHPLHHYFLTAFSVLFLLENLFITASHSEKKLVSSTEEKARFKFRHLYFFSLLPAFCSYIYSSESRVVG